MVVYPKGIWIVCHEKEVYERDGYSNHSSRIGTQDWEEYSQLDFWFRKEEKRQRRVTMKRKKKAIHDLSMSLFTNEEMSGAPAPIMEQTFIPQTDIMEHEPIPQTDILEPEPKNVIPAEDFSSETFYHEPSFEVDSRLLTKEMFFAIRHLKRLDVNQVRMIAMEMAMVWQNGKNLQETYVLQSIPNMEIDYHQFIAYYYCSFNMAFPNMMDKIQLPYEKEFQTAMYDLGAQRGGVS